MVTGTQTDGGAGPSNRQGCGMANLTLSSLLVSITWTVSVCFPHQMGASQGGAWVSSPAASPYPQSDP